MVASNNDRSSYKIGFKLVCNSNYCDKPEPVVEVSQKAVLQETKKQVKTSKPASRCSDVSQEDDEEDYDDEDYEDDYEESYQDEAYEDGEEYSDEEDSDEFDDDCTTATVDFEEEEDEEDEDEV